MFKFFIVLSAFCLTAVSALADGPVTPAGTSASTAAVVQGATGGVSLGTKPGSLTIVPLDVSSVTTGSIAVTALATGHAAAGGWLATANVCGICVDQVTTAGTATGTPSTSACVGANQPFYLVPNGHAVSVNSACSGVSFAGEGLQ